MPEPLPAVRVCPLNGCPHVAVTWTDPTQLDTLIRTHLREHITQLRARVNNLRPLADTTPADA